MTIKNGTYPTLPPKGDTQRTIFRYLAVNTPKTMREISEALELDYAYTNRTVKKLAKLRYLKPIQGHPKQYRGQTFQRYWLTDEGVFHALTVTDYSQYPSFLEKAAEIRQKDTLFDEKIDFLLDWLRRMNEKYFHMVLYYLNMAARGHVLPASIFVHPEVSEPYTRAALEHPEYKPKIKQIYRELLNALNLLRDVIREEDPELLQELDRLG